MKIVTHPDEIINSTLLRPGSCLYASGNAATPQVLLSQLAKDEQIRDVDLLGVLFLGEITALFEKECCQRITHRVIFNGPCAREAVNRGWAKYQLMHLGDIPCQLRETIKPDVALISVSGPDNGGN